MSKRRSTLGIVPALLRQYSVRIQLLVLYGVLLSLLTVGGLSLYNSEIEASARHQADSIGRLLSAQTATVARDMLITGDRLSLNVLLGQLIENPYVVDASIYSIDNKLIVKSSSDVPSKNDVPLVFESPINYQDVIAGNVRLMLDSEILLKKPKESLVALAVLNGILLFVGLLLINLYALRLRNKIRSVESHVVDLLDAVDPSDKVVNEVQRLTMLVDKALSQRDREAEAAALATQQLMDHTVTTTVTNEQSFIVAIKVKNLSRLQQTLTPLELQQILKTHNQVINHVAHYYNGEVTFTPEGNAYLRFSNQIGYNNGAYFAVNTFLCALAIKAISANEGAKHAVKLQLGFGFSCSEAAGNFPKNIHPAVRDSAASLALSLANHTSAEGLFVYKAELAWLPEDALRLFDATPNLVGIFGAGEAYQPLLDRGIQEVKAQLQ